MKLTYFSCRGRFEPVLLMLEDSGTPYTERIMPYDEWFQNKRAGKAQPPEIPFNGLPVLEDADEMEAPFILGETGAIQLYLQEKLQPEGAPPVPLQIRALLEMVREASAFFLNRVFQFSVNEDWLAPPQRVLLRNRVIIPFLNSVDHYISVLGPHIIPGPNDRLKAATASAFVAIEFATDLFPGLKAEFGPEANKKWRNCAGLVKAMEEREKIKDWIQRAEVKKKSWTSSQFGTAEWIAAEAKKYDHLTE